DFKQIECSNDNNHNFQCYGSHTVVLNGQNNIQKVSFSNSSSHFNNLKITKDKENNYIFNPDNCWNTLYLDTNVRSVSIVFDAKSLKPMDEYTLFAIVEGINKPSQEVTWKLTGNTDKTTAIDEFGVLTVGEDEKADKITVTATSVADNTKSDSIELTIEKVIPVVLGVRINPTVISMVNGEKFSFEAVVYGLYNPDQSVNWSISGNKSSNTKISAGGTLTIAEDETADKITVTATSTVDKTKSASVTVDIVQIKIVSTVDNVTVTMTKGETQKFKAVVTGANNPNQNVVWSVRENNSANTVITEDGELTVAEDETATTIVVRATSVDNPEKYGEFAINISTDDETSVLIGDVNGDGVINIIDVTAIQKYKVQMITLNDEQLKVADVNGDGVVNINDATRIQKYLVHIITSLR
ncbi:MAG: hypothetical protein J1E96_03235, partial [Ruminococcus sp.]|nr:hypothetical protein [Ruminococcus sp.]